MTYDASSIQVLDRDEVFSKFFWAKANDLSITYCRPLAWIERGLQACERACVPHDYFIDRYLKKQPISKHDGVDAAMRDIHIEGRQTHSKMR